MQTDKTFGEALTDLLKERDMSARELARREGTMNPAGGTISHFVLGYIFPEYETMERLAKALEVPPSYFAEWRLETIRRQIDWHAPRDQMPQGRRRWLNRALKQARSLGLDV